MAADIRPARASDVDALLAIENAVFPTDRLKRQSFRRLIGRPSAAVLVAQVGGEVAGYCIVLFRAGNPAARLYSISTATEMAGQGLGRALIEAAERVAVERGKRSLRLEVRQDNERAVSIYRRAGFQADRQQTRLLSGRDDRAADGENLWPALNPQRPETGIARQLSPQADRSPGWLKKFRGAPPYDLGHPHRHGRTTSIRSRRRTRSSPIATTSRIRRCSAGSGRRSSTCRTTTATRAAATTPRCWPVRAATRSSRRSRR